jgi:hypothetical protein
MIVELYLRNHSLIFFGIYVMEPCLVNDERQVHPVLEQIHSDRAVVTKIKDLLLPEEANYVKSCAQNSFQPSRVLGKDGDMFDLSRTSSTAF